MQKHGVYPDITDRIMPMWSLQRSPPSVCSSLLGGVSLSSEDLFLLIASKCPWKDPHLIPNDVRRLGAHRLLEASFQLVHPVRP